MLYKDPPFDLGQTLKGTDDDGNLVNEHWQGAVFEFPDVDRTPAVRGGKGRRSGGTLRCVCVRNTKGSALTVATATHGLVLGFAKAGVGRLAATTVDGYSLAEGAWAGIGDPELGATTVADDDLFWLVIGGAVPVYAEGSGISAGLRVVADAGTDGHMILADASNIDGELLGIALDDIGDNAAGLVHIAVNY